MSGAMEQPALQTMGRETKAQGSGCVIWLELRICPEEKGEAKRAWLQGRPEAGASLPPSSFGQGQRESSQILFQVKSSQAKLLEREAQEVIQTTSSGY